MSSVLEKIGDFIKGGDVNADFDKIAGTLPANTLKEGLAHALDSDDTPPVPQMVSSLFAQSNPDQKAGFLNAVASSIGPTTASQIASSAGLGNIAGALSAANVTPQQASQITPQSLQTFAQSVEGKNLSIVDAASSFYAQHPTLVKSIGAGALALLMAKISQARR
jgi:hypothetical protein